MTNLTLYWLVPKDRSNRVRWLLRELDVDFSEQQMNASAGEHRQANYLDVNPFGKVPAIATDAEIRSPIGSWDPFGRSSARGPRLRSRGA